MRGPGLVALCLAAPAMAEEVRLPFQSPGGLVHCEIVHDWEVGRVRCDISTEAERSHTDPPEDCAAGWGHAFELAPSGAGRVLCVEGTIADPSVQVMEPGYSHGIGGVVCFSEPGGMTCMNAAAHGFTLTKAKQTIF